MSSLLSALLLSANAQTGSEVLNRIVHAGAEPSYEQRHHLLQGLSARELESGASVLFDFMEQGKPPAGMEVDAYLSLTNDIYDKLLAEGVASQALLNHALKVIPDEAQETVWRDYCVQKLADTLVSPGVSADARLRGLELLQQLMQGSCPGMQGTALIVARRLEPTAFGQQYPSTLSARFIGEQALRCASDPDSPLIDRVTALQIAGRYTPEHTRTYASTLLNAAEPAPPIMLKVSAIATLGHIGDETHLPLLQTFRRSADIRLRKAARVAMQRITS